MDDELDPVAVGDTEIPNHQGCLTARRHATTIRGTEFANGLLTEFLSTSRFQPSPTDTPIRESQLRQPFPTTRHHQKNAPGAIQVLMSKDVQVQVLSPAQHCDQGK